jgi:hypothetical protein
MVSLVYATGRGLLGTHRATKAWQIQGGRVVHGGRREQRGVRVGRGGKGAKKNAQGGQRREGRVGIAGNDSPSTRKNKTPYGKKSVRT